MNDAGNQNGLLFKDVQDLTDADKLITAAVNIQVNPDAFELAYMARQLVQCTLPHSDPGNVPLWTRRNGKLTLTLVPYIDRKTLKAQYPYGSIPRLLMFWLVTEVTQKKTQKIRLGNSLDAFMREIGLNPRTGGGKRGDAARLHMQMKRLFRCTISIEDDRPEKSSWVDMMIAPEGSLWWDPKRSDEDNLWESWIELGPRFFAALSEAPVPVDMRALRALKRSPLALDLYAWLTYTTYAANVKSQPRIVPWEGLHGQMGAEYARIRRFREAVLEAIKKIKMVFPTLNLEITSDSLTVHPAKTSVPIKLSSKASV